MIPFRDNVRYRSAPIMTIALIVSNCAVFLLELSRGHEVGSFIKTFGFTPAHPSVVPLLTSMFLHGGLLHLAGNMWYLWIFGRGVEDRFGHLRFLVFYICCGIAAGIAQMLMSFSSTTPIIGASGAVAGVLGAYLVCYPFARIQTFVFIQIIELPAILVLGTWFVFQFLNGTVALYNVTPVSGGGIARWAHVGGFLVGMLGGRSSMFLARHRTPIET